MMTEKLGELRIDGGVKMAGVMSFFLFIAWGMSLDNAFLIASGLFAIAEALTK